MWELLEIPCYLLLDHAGINGEKALKERAKYDSNM